MTRVQEHLSTRDLFAAGGTRVHVNRPLHLGDTPLHDHDFIEIAVVRAGHALHRQLDALVPAPVGSIWLLLPGQWHAWERCQNLRLANICFQRELLASELCSCRDDPLMARWWQQPAPLHWQVAPPQLETLGRRIDDLAAHCGEAGPLAYGLLAAVLGELRRSAPPLAQCQGMDPVVRQILEAFTADPARPWTLAELARRHGLERSYLGRRFRRATGLSPMAWLARRRCELAAIRLLCSDQAVAAIGAAVGWSDANYFARRFHQEMGVSPSRYRQQLPLPPRLPRSADWIQW
ncbi:MAG: AraC family transcriptional regulator [Planctomycetota bacterium]|nr:MAG: AraC family transcriptional regulator [Planctomycetota bacterium]